MMIIAISVALISGIALGLRLLDYDHRTLKDKITVICAITFSVSLFISMAYLLAWGISQMGTC